MASLKYRDPADGQWKIAPLPTPSMTHAGLAGVANDDHTDHYTPERADTQWYAHGGGGQGNTAPADANYLTNNVYMTSGGAAQLMLHNPGVSAVLLYPRTGPTLGVVDHVTGGSFRPVMCGEDLNMADTLCNWGTMWMNMSDRVSGPHGSHTHWVQGGAGWSNYTSGALTYPVINCPGMFKIQVTADLYVTNPATSGSMPEIFMGVNCRWTDGTAFSWNNAAHGGLGRLSMLGNGITGLQTATVGGYVMNIPGKALVACGSLTAAGAGYGAIGGDYKHGFEFWPYATNDAAKQYGWVAG